ncbi:Acyl acyltransferase [Fusarium albosuccineum]|uniref:Acyl acyltransferase n=1 Tax=Fusarium albosuccineum TaxID=1237068 RepID=A0A8H4P7L0_9HYPO|nr:Acyl acyltransferase [Fusarium albosuccineum]
MATALEEKVERPKGPKPEDLVFERVMDDRVTTHFENNAQAWASPLSTPAYLDIQHKLCTSETVKKRISFWVLHLPGNPTAVMSSCTTYVRDALMMDSNGPRSVKAVVISDIFTHSEYRMRGIAKQLLKRLQDHMDESMPEIEFSLVFGSWDLDMYQGLGWEPLRATQMRLMINPDYECKIPEGVSSNFKLLGFRDVAELVDGDINICKLRLSACRDGKTHVQLVPTDPLARWHLIRSRLFSQYLGRGTMASQKHGALVGIDIPVWGWWVHDFQRRRLVIGRLFESRKSTQEVEVSLFLELAMWEARKCGLREVVIWDPSPQCILGGNGLVALYDKDVVLTVLEKRLERVPCLRWRMGEKREVVLREGQFYSWS